jgi:hypothetical protein
MGVVGMLSLRKTSYRNIVCAHAPFTLTRQYFFCAERVDNDSYSLFLFCSFLFFFVPFCSCSFLFLSVPFFSFPHEGLTFSWTKEDLVEAMVLFISMQTFGSPLYFSGTLAQVGHDEAHPMWQLMNTFHNRALEFLIVLDADQVMRRILKDGIRQQRER